MRMKWETSRNEKHKYFNEEKLALGEKENTSALMNIAQEDGSNILKLFKNLWLNNLQDLKTLIVLWIKWRGMSKIKDKDVIGAAQVMSCQTSSWIMGLRMCGEGRTQIPLSSPAMIGPLARIQDRQGLYWYKNC